MALFYTHTHTHNDNIIYNKLCILCIYHISMYHIYNSTIVCTVKIVINVIDISIICIQIICTGSAFLWHCHDIYIRPRWHSRLTLTRNPTVPVHWFVRIRFNTFVLVRHIILYIRII